MTRKVIIEVCITFSISVIIYFLVDFNIIFWNQWDLDKIANILHTWLTLLTAYYLYNWLLSLAFKRWIMNRLIKWVWVLSGISLLILAYVAITEIVYYKLYYNITSLKAETTFFEFDMPVALIVLIIGSLYFHQKFFHISIQPGGQIGLESAIIKAHKGKEVLLIGEDDILLLYSLNGIVWLINSNLEKLITDYTLDGILNELNPNHFFRVNRQVIISRKCVKGFERLNYQKIQVKISDDLTPEQSLIVSKYNAPNFKKWLTKSA
jgi:hypothetical protein